MLSTATSFGNFRPLWVVAAVLLVKSGWPSTPSAFAPLAVVAAASKRSTRLLLVSPRHQPSSAVQRDTSGIAHPTLGRSGSIAGEVGLAEHAIGIRAIGRGRGSVEAPGSCGWRISATTAARRFDRDAIWEAHAALGRSDGAAGEVGLAEHAIGIRAIGRGRGSVEAQHAAVVAVQHPLWVVAAVLLVKSGWPSTPSAFAPFASDASVAKRSTRWLLLSATNTLPVVGSTATPCGLRIRFCVVAKLPLVKFAWPSTSKAF